MGISLYRLDSGLELEDLAPYIGCFSFALMGALSCLNCISILASKPTTLVVNWANSCLVA